MLAEAESCERLYVIGIITAFDEARASIAGEATEVPRISRMMARKTRLKSLFCQPARLKFQSRRASSGALRASLHPILCDR